MGIKIEHNGATILTLTCDQRHGMFSDKNYEVFAAPEGYIGAYQQAMDRGWGETHRDGQRTFLCPQCSGKKAR